MCLSWGGARLGRRSLRGGAGLDGRNLREDAKPSRKSLKEPEGARLVGGAISGGWGLKGGAEPH
jgi:hypothetical protein